MDEQELADNESESDLSNIAEDQIVKEADDISDSSDSDTSYMSDDANTVKLMM